LEPAVLQVAQVAVAAVTVETQPFWTAELRLLRLMEEAAVAVLAAPERLLLRPLRKEEETRALTEFQGLRPRLRKQEAVAAVAAIIKAMLRLLPGELEALEEAMFPEELEELRPALEEMAELETVTQTMAEGDQEEAVAAAQTTTVLQDRVSEEQDTWAVAEAAAVAVEVAQPATDARAALEEPVLFASTPSDNVLTLQ
jgi:hypothetical protein